MGEGLSVNNNEAEVQRPSTERGPSPDQEQNAESLEREFKAIAESLKLLKPCEFNAEAKGAERVIISTEDISSLWEAAGDLEKILIKTQTMTGSGSIKLGTLKQTPDYAHTKFVEQEPETRTEEQAQRLEKLLHQMTELIQSSVPIEFNADEEGAERVIVSRTNTRDLTDHIRHLRDIVKESMKLEALAKETGEVSLKPIGRVQ